LALSALAASVFFASLSGLGRFGLRFPLASMTKYNEVECNLWGCPPGFAYL
jgi:hypothetical protein